MGIWGKIIGGVAGFAMGGPPGAIIGAALGHAADTGAMPRPRLPFGTGQSFNPAAVAALFGRRDQLFAIAVVVLSAKLAKCDGPVKREEIDAFKHNFRIPPEAMRDIGRLFDQARDSNGGFESFADQLGEAFADNRGMLEEVLAGLFAIARADGPVNGTEAAFLRRVQRGFNLDDVSWDYARGDYARGDYARGDQARGDRAHGGGARRASPGEPDPYATLGVARDASNEDLHATWKRLMRENHPDSLAARGVPAAFIASANDKVARINAAWDRIKRERGL
jgi:DnaJ like chaperone protein